MSSRSTNPDSVIVKAYFTEREHSDIKAECALVGKSFTEYFLFLRAELKPKKGKK